MRFPTLAEVLLIHQQIVAETDGQSGLQDQSLLDSALKAAENCHCYDQADEIVCAATYACHLCMAHAFIDGHKRFAAVVSETFLFFNGWQLTLENKDLVDMFLEIADGVLLRDAIEATFSRCAISIGD